MRLSAISKDQYVNAMLRLLPLAAKLILTLFMGRYFSLREMGLYGLSFGAIMLLSLLAGQSFGYIVARDIVHVAPLTALHKMRDQIFLLFLNHLALIVGAIILATQHTTALPTNLITLIVISIVLESYAGTLNSNMNSLNQQLMANALFFVRAGLWVLPVVMLGLLDPELRRADIVLLCWIVGSAISIIANHWYWRNMPWREAMVLPIDWHWMKAGLKKCSLIWVGNIGLIGSTYIDRFVAEHFLTLDDVGVITFYSSFATAILTMAQSGVLAFAYPRLITMHRDGHTKKFLREAQQAFGQVALGAGLMSILLGIVVPILGIYTQRPALANNATTLWLMLAGMWIRANAETLNYVLYARHQDRAMWLGNILFLGFTVGGNAVLVPMFGISGIGWAAVISASLLLFWRWKHAGETIYSR